MTATTTRVTAQAMDDLNAESAMIVVNGCKAWVYRRLVRGRRSKWFCVKGTPPGLHRDWARSTKCVTKAEAIKRGTLLWRAKLAEHLEPVRAALEESKVRRARVVCSIGELLDAHERAEQHGRLHCQARAAATARAALCRAIAWRQGWHALREGMQREWIDTERVRACSAAVLEEPEFIGELELAYVAPAGADFLAQDVRRRGLVSLLTNARAMFKESLLSTIYRNLVLPELKHFLAVQPRPAVVAEKRVLSDDAVREMARVALGLKESNPRLYLVHVLHRHLGLRNIEIEAARVEWIERFAAPREIEIAAGEAEEVTLADGRTIRVVLAEKMKRVAVGQVNVKRRSYFKPKRSAGCVAISADVWAEIARWVEHRRPDEPLVPAASATERRELIYIAHADFVRPWTAEHAKKGYELRAWGATVVERLHKSREYAEYFLRHGKQTTAEQSYLERPLAAPITLGDCGVA
jgi:hypothetical protein